MTSHPPRHRRRRQLGSRMVRRLALATIAVLLTVPAGPATARAGGDEPISEQHAHIAGEPGSNEVDLALRTRQREGHGRSDPGGWDADGAGYVFEAVPRSGGGASGSEGPCAQAGGRLVSVSRLAAGPDGGPVTPLRIACLARGFAGVDDGGTPGITAEQAAALLRSVTLPGGTVRASPGGVALAGMDVRFWVEGAARSPVDLAIGSAVLHAEFTVTGYRWSFGDHRRAAASAGSPADGAMGATRHVYERRGAYPVTVEVTWSAQGFLNGTPVARVDGLISRTALTYRVDEVYALLSG